MDGRDIKIILADIWVFTSKISKNLGFPTNSGVPQTITSLRRYGYVVPEVNDVLVDMVDALDELDTHIVKGPRMATR